MSKFEDNPFSDPTIDNPFAVSSLFQNIIIRFLAFVGMFLALVNVISGPCCAAGCEEHKQCHTGLG